MVYSSDVDAGPTSLTQSHPESGWITDISIQDGFIFATDWLHSDDWPRDTDRGGLRVYAWETPHKAPEFITHLSLPDGISWKVHVQDDRAYVAGLRGGLSIIDIRDPRQPRLIGQLPYAQTRGVVHEVHLDFPLAYLTVGSWKYDKTYGEAGLLVVDISNATAPAPLEFIPAPTTGWSARVGEMLYAAGEEGELLAFSLPKGRPSRESTPQRRAEKDIDIGLLLAAEGVFFNLKAFEWLPMLATPAGQLYFQLPGGDAPSRLIGLNLSSPDNPTLIGISSAEPTSFLGFDLAILDRQLISASGRHLSVYQMNVLGSPALTSSIRTETLEPISAVADDQGRFYIAEAEDRFGQYTSLTVLDLTKRPGSTSVETPVIGRLEFDEHAVFSPRQMLVQDDLLFALNDSEIVVVDLRDPSALHERERIPLQGYGTQIAIFGQHLYVTSGRGTREASSTGALSVFDFSQTGMDSTAAIEKLDEIAGEFGPIEASERHVWVIEYRSSDSETYPERPELIALAPHASDPETSNPLRRIGATPVEVTNSPYIVDLHVGAKEQLSLVDNASNTQILDIQDPGQARLIGSREPDYSFLMVFDLPNEHFYQAGDEGITAFHDSGELTRLSQRAGHFGIVFPDDAIEAIDVSAGKVVAVGNAGLWVLEMNRP